MYAILAVIALLIYQSLGISLWTILAALLIGYAAGSYYVGPSHMTTRRKLMMATWDTAAEGTVFGVITCKADNLLKYVEAQAAKGNKVTITTVITKALAVAFRQAPAINCKISFGKFIPHKTIDISCLVALDDGKDLAVHKIAECDKKSLSTIQQELAVRAAKIRAHKDKDFEASKPLMKLLPVGLLRPMVATIGWMVTALGIEVPALGLRANPFGSAMVTSVGMLGVKQGFIPFTPFARVPLLLMIGAIEKVAAVENDQIVIQNQINLTATLDHRFADGTEASRMAKQLKAVIENPELLDQE